MFSCEFCEIFTNTFVTEHPQTTASDLKKPILARLFCLNFSSKAPRCSPVPLKFEPCNLQHCKKNYCKLNFCVLLEQLLSHIIFGRLHYYEVTLVKKYNKPIRQKSETKVLKQKKKNHNQIVQIQRAKKLGRFEIKLDNV